MPQGRVVWALMEPKIVASKSTFEYVGRDEEFGRVPSLFCGEVRCRIVSIAVERSVDVVVRD